MGPYDSWQAVVLVAGTAAVVGAGIGAASALIFAERRLGGVEESVDGIERRVSLLERLDERVRRLERGDRLPAAEG
jgi:hypothetical protein